MSEETKEKLIILQSFLVSHGRNAEQLKEAILDLIEILLSDESSTTEEEE